MEKRKNISNLILLGISTCLLVVLDQITKLAAQQRLKGTDGLSVIQGVFELQYLENRGSAFGMMQGKRVFFIVMAVVVLVVISYIYVRIPLTKRFLYMRMIAVLYLAGAVGNAVDRVVHGYVVDFFYFSLIDFPIFNVADIYVTVGTFSLIGLILFYYKDEDFEQIRLWPGK